MKAVGRSVVRLPGPWSLHRRHRPTEVDKDVRSSGESKAYKRCKACKKIKLCDGQPCFPRPMERHLTSRERIVRSYCSVGSRAIDSSFHKFLERSPAWTKPGLIVSFTSGFDQLKI